MKKRPIRKLTIARETLLRLEDETLRAAAGRTGESICQCVTHICISIGYTGCNTCDCS